MTSSRRLFHRKKGWRPRDYLYHLLGLGEDVESARKSMEHQFTDCQELRTSNFEVALIAATEAEAKQLVSCILQHCSTALPIDGRRCGQLNFTALGQDQTWPDKRFDELHWLSTSSDSEVPWEQLSGLADIVHVHHFSKAAPLTAPQACNYQWRSQQELTDFWASLYLAREIRGIPGLKWDSFAPWPPGSTVGQTAAGWGSTPTAAVASLLASTPLATLDSAPDALLVIEANYGFTWGDYAYVMEQVAKAIGREVSSTGWMATNYSGYGLKLLVFSPS
ncbi:hypothetical protein [Aquipseudomonas alcaligenes]|uniref:hypothetical protein n=1 Tax=Aquipseudomonas alcaligenes TaxID=43263 RepID=UPI0037497988